MRRFRSFQIRGRELTAKLFQQDRLIRSLSLTERRSGTGNDEINQRTAPTEPFDVCSHVAVRTDLELSVEFIVTSIAAGPITGK